MHILTGIAFSHYVEKARWVLDRFGVPYTDHRVLPMLHRSAVRRIHGGKLGTEDRASSRYSTPVLQTPSGAVLCDSDDIVRYVSEHFAPAGYALDPGEGADAWMQRFHDKLGPHTRRLGYSAVFARPPVFRQLIVENSSGPAASLFAGLAPVARVAMTRLLNLNEEGATRSMGVVEREFDAVATQLSDGRPYLAGERFTWVDLTFACMAAPAVLPVEYSAWFPTADQVGERWAAPIRAFQNHTAGQFALRMFAEERHRVVASMGAT
jgi:glutathione S-transferase